MLKCPNYMNLWMKKLISRTTCPHEPRTKTKNSQNPTKTFLDNISRESNMVTVEELIQKTYL
jgi:hypothetical protein